MCKQTFTLVTGIYIYYLKLVVYNASLGRITNIYCKRRQTIASLNDLFEEFHVLYQAEPVWSNRVAKLFTFKQEILFSLKKPNNIDTMF